MPVLGLEELFLQDPQAAREELQAALAEEDPERGKAVLTEWSPSDVTDYLAQHRYPQTKAAELLALARQMGTISGSLCVDCNPPCSSGGHTCVVPRHDEHVTSGANMPGAVGFAERLLEVVDTGRRTATYKLALLMALLDLAHAAAMPMGGHPGLLHTRDIAEQVAALYGPRRSFRTGFPAPATRPV